MTPPRSPDAASPSAAEPRPAGVPEGACFNARQGTWLAGDQDDQGRHQGLVRVYTRDGLLSSELHYEDGELHGPFRRFHPDGSIARSGHFERGRLEGKVIAYTGPPSSPERLRACCVPPGATTLVAHYDGGRCRAELFYDVDQRRLLDDGTPYPDRPESVPSTARYLPTQGSWEDGHYGAYGRHGRFRWWTLEGRLIEVAEYEVGKRHGTWERYDELGSLFSLHLQQDVLNGPCWRRVAPGQYQRPEFVFERGAYSNGLAVGEWTMENAEHCVVAQVDLGARVPDGLSADAEAFSLHATGKRHDASTTGTWAATLEGVATELEAGRQLALALLVRLRAAGLRGSREQALRLLETPTAWSETATDDWVRQLRQRDASTSTQLAELLTALLRGASAARVLRELAALTLDRPRAALDLARVAKLLDSSNVHVLAVEALALFELGRINEGKRLLQRLDRDAPGATTTLDHSLRCTFPDFTFWPDNTTLDETVAEHLPRSVEQDLPSLQRAIAKTARRLHDLREALRSATHDDDDSWFPPDVSFLFQQMPVSLDQYDFTVEEDGESDHIIVDERVATEDTSVPALMRQVRLQWQALCWLCFAAGSTRIEMPKTRRPPNNFAQALSTAFSRYFRCSDQQQTAGLRSKLHKLPTFSWEGVAIEQLSGRALEMARDDYREMRAVLFFAADASCRSLWQDDLRG